MLQKTSHKGRWLLFLCIGLLYLWVLWQGWLSWQALPFPTVRGRAVSPMSPPPFDTTLISAALFSVFLMLHISLYWIRFSTRQHHWYVLYFTVQGLLVLLMVLLWEGDHLFIALYLYLALIGEAIIVLRQSSLVGLVIGFLVLFILSQGISFTETKTRWFDWSLYVMLLIPLVPFGVSYVQVRRREHDQLLLHELAIAHAQLKTSATQIAELTLLTERQRMARELHDTLAQGLAGMILQLEVANSHLSHQRAARAQEIVEQVMEQARATLADARRAIDDLRIHDASLDDVAHAVQKEINRFTIATGIVCTVELDGLTQAPASHSEHILRAITEGLANVARHAQARHVWVQAAINKHDLEIEIRDDGIGFEPVTETKPIGHYGLLGLRERARLVGGSLQITSSPGCGTTLKLRLPEKQKESIS